MAIGIRGQLKGKSITRADAALIIIVALLLGGAFYLDYISGNAGTKDWLLLAARKWLNGQVLYVDIFEVNPPLIVWIYALPVCVSMHAGLLDFHALALLGLCIAALSLGLCLGLIRLYPPLVKDRRKQLHFLLLLALVLVAFINPIYFADREHLFFMLTLPYMLRNMPGMASVTVSLPLRIVVGLLAGIGFCIKPYCIIIFAGIQLLVLLQKRGTTILWSMENILIYGCGALYLFLVTHFTPSYLHDVLPIALATYSAYKGSTDVFVLFGVFFTFAMTFIEFRLGHTSDYRCDILYFLGVCAFCLLYALANNGWTYAYLPLESVALIVTCLVFWEFKALARRAQGYENSRSFRFGAAACILNLFANGAMVVLVFFAALMTHYNNDALNRENGLQRVVRESKARTFGTLTIDFLPWAHLVRATGASWDTRFNCVWMLPKFIVSDAAFMQSHAWILKTVADDLAEDMDVNKPDLMFVNQHPVVCPACKPAEILPFFLSYPAFAKAWVHYRYLQAVNVCPSSPEKAMAKHAVNDTQSGKKACMYDVYQRSR